MFALNACERDDCSAKFKAASVGGSMADSLPPLLLLSMCAVSSACWDDVWDVAAESVQDSV